MQDTEPLPWGALDRFQAHYIVRAGTGNDMDVTAKTVLSTQGHFGAKKVVSITWNGGRLAGILNDDTELSSMISNQSVHDAAIFIEPTKAGIRIYGKWKNHLEFGVPKDLFEIYDRIAGHIKSL
ncbi:conserved hypothetical protein [Cenarchaeum symbiosum A]|uniref:Uncharacterized protein n=1 Tax=Cenarchaeum symbiosum (strain A) TaxID=414004 RepID=A0RWF2_CENSY|nr:conserved hypothetical protein [Cenarchaeum symbiosum A]